MNQLKERELTFEEQYQTLQKLHWEALRELKEAKQETARWQYLLVELTKAWEALRPKITTAEAAEMYAEANYEAWHERLKPYLDYTTNHLPAKFESSCFTNAAKDEPVFVLRGSDILAPEVVREWVRLVVASVPVFPEAKCKEAEGIAVAMEKWPNRKLPD